MSKAFITEQYLTDIANAIRTVEGSTTNTTTYTPPQMANAIKNIKTAEPEYKINIEQSENQTITVKTDYDTANGYSDKTSSFSMKPITCYPNTAIATIKADPGYKPGILNQESFTFSDTNRTVTFSATSAIEVKSVTYKTTNSPYVFENVNDNNGRGVCLYTTLGIDPDNQFYAIGDTDIPTDFKVASNSVMQIIKNNATIINTGYYDSGYSSICKNFYLISIPSTNDIYVYCYANYDNETDLLTNTEYKNPTIKIGTLTLDLSNFTRTFDKQHYLPPDKKQYACNTYHIKDADLIKQLNLIFCGNEAAYKTYVESYTYMYNWFVKMFEIMLSSDSSSLETIKTEFKKYEQPMSDLNNLTTDEGSNLFTNLINYYNENHININIDPIILGNILGTYNYADNTQASFVERLPYIFNGSTDIKQTASMFCILLTTTAKASDTDTTSYNLLELIAAYRRQIILNPITAKDLPIEITYQYISTFE